MGESTKIAWTGPGGKTFNPWEGCTKVSDACDFCYAEARNKRFSGGANWGPGAPRRLTSQHNRNNPFRWNRQAAERGERYGVFCGSLCDWADAEVDPAWRAELFDTIEATPNLEWLLLSKRHALAQKHLPETPWPHVRVGFTIENQAMANLRSRWLRDLKLAGWKTFASYEGALGLVEWWPLVNPRSGRVCIDWLIYGDESGHSRARQPGHLDWARAARDACAKAGVPFFMKQVGLGAGKVTTDIADFPLDLRVQQFPEGLHG